ncbi:MAG: maltose alpha-D-glucosyltransferase [Spirochaetota bacterium]
MAEAPWYKDAVIYELHVRSFYDSNGDGMGDFRGLTERLDYLQDLGVNAIWLLPFYPSPWRDDGYDISDYRGVHGAYGSIRDFKRFLREAHARDLKVITELVINHTSNQHPWFERARNAKPGSNYRDFYVWSDTPDKYRDARIIFQDFETSNWTWDPVAGQYYWHRFFSHQPDLNFENLEVKKAVLNVLDYWFAMGVDGLRLDAVPYLYEREGTNCENLPETHEFLKELRSYVDAHYEDRMLLAEANQWPEDTVPYFGDDDECHMAFHFPLMPRLFMSVRMEDSFPLMDILEQTPPIPKGAQWGIFLRNHDELTLEMVTDEERDYMYRVYARDPHHRVNLGIRRRLAPLLENDRRKLELMNVLLFSLPGTPVIYYGDEIGMGDNVYLGDRNGVRTPMQWSPDRNASFSQANPQSLYLPVIIDPEYHYEQVNIETQQANSSSLLWWMKRLIATRRRFRAFSRGTIKFVQTSNTHIFAFVREYEDEKVLVVANFSRYSQFADLYLDDYTDHVPEEIFSQSRFPQITDRPYSIMIGSSDYYWFVLRKVADGVVEDGGAGRTEISITARDWSSFSPKLKELLEEKVLRPHISGSRWYREKGSTIRRIRIEDSGSIGTAESRSRLLMVRVDLANDRSDSYLIIVSRAPAGEAEMIAGENPKAIICQLGADGSDGALYDGVYNPAVCQSLLQLFTSRRKLKTAKGEIAVRRGKRLSRLARELPEPVTSRVLKVEQSNTSIVYPDVFFFKLYRKLEEGINPDIELLQYLTEEKRFEHTPTFAGNLEYKRGKRDSAAAGLLVSLESNQGDGWSYAISAVDRFFDNVLELADAKPLAPPASIFADGIQQIPDEFLSLADGLFVEMMHLLGKRTGELHLALASDRTDKSFAPEPFSKLYQRSAYQNLRSQIRRTMTMARKASRKLDDSAKELVSSFLESEAKMLDFISGITDHKIDAEKIRVHGDYHLGQVLFTGRDFVIIDLEGEPARTLSERRLKFSAFRDLAGMIRSFHYAVSSQFLERTSIRPEDSETLEPWIETWYGYIASIFLSSYLETVDDAGFIPPDRSDTEMLLSTFMLEKAVYEIGYEINNRPDWLMIPLRGVNFVLDRLETTP